MSQKINKKKSKFPLLKSIQQLESLSDKVLFPAKLSKANEIIRKTKERP